MRQEPATRASQPRSRQLKTRADDAAQCIRITRNESEAQPQLNVALRVCSFQTTPSL